MYITIKHLFLTLWNDAILRGRWDLLREDLSELIRRE
jgi:hypothetical protein